ncbi:YopJ/AvrA family T3SS effector serine/threonine acetyltransferase [Bartonella sp. CB175]|uniref:YopJ/AvrA family T3SS effector serine/threonine acetyltransferase n=1 Tax=Bartonella sp. CB175 TaxID=3112256 RepID=UPI00300E5D72
MKPNDSQNVTASSSQAQAEHSSQEILEGAHASQEILGGAHADSETDTSLQEEIAFSSEKLKDIIAGLEKDITSGSWIHTNYAHVDIKMMPALVKQANEKYPDMKLQLVNDPYNLASLMEKAINDQVQSSRFIISSKTLGIHFAVIDYRAVGVENSFILFEPTKFHGIPQDMLMTRILMAVKSRGLPNCHFSMAEMDIQRSFSECGIFSLALAKKLHTESARLEKLHEDNVKGILCEPDTPIPYDKLDLYLPATFYKHTQGMGRLQKYIKSNPNAADEKVNKKGETLLERLDNNSVATKEYKAVSVSSHRKRVREYKGALTL